MRAPRAGLEHLPDGGVVASCQTCSWISRRRRWRVARSGAFTSDSRQRLPARRPRLRRPRRCRGEGGDVGVSRRGRLTMRGYLATIGTCALWRWNTSCRRFLDLQLAGLISAASSRPRRRQELFDRRSSPIRARRCSAAAAIDLHARVRRRRTGQSVEAGVAGDGVPGVKTPALTVPLRRMPEKADMNSALVDGRRGRHGGWRHRRRAVAGG